MRPPHDWLVWVRFGRPASPRQRYADARKPPPCPYYTIRYAKGRRRVLCSVCSSLSYLPPSSRLPGTACGHFPLRGPWRPRAWERWHLLGGTSAGMGPSWSFFCRAAFSFAPSRTPVGPSKTKTAPAPGSRCARAAERSPRFSRAPMHFRRLHRCFSERTSPSSRPRPRTPGLRRRGSAGAAYPATSSREDRLPLGRAVG